MKWARTRTCNRWMLSRLDLSESEVEARGESRLRGFSNKFRAELLTTVALNRSMSTELKLLKLERVKLV